MPRPRRDGTPSNPTRKKTLTEMFCRKAKAEGGKPTNYWDALERGLCLRIQPGGSRAVKVVYSVRGRPRWYHIGNVPLSDARRMAVRVRLAVSEGKDPQAEKKAARGAGTFAELHSDYVEQYAKRHNRSWRQAASSVKRHVLPRWGKLNAKSITRADARQLFASIPAVVAANFALSNTSAVFAWGIKMERVELNPCLGIARNATKSRERIADDSELPVLWPAFDRAGLIASSALKVILLAGQRPGEVACMRWEHISPDGSWTMPGKPDPNVGWPGTKNGESHKVWLPQAVRGIIANLGDDKTGFVFANSRGSPVRDLHAAMRQICVDLGMTNAVRPHDLRRTHGSTITKLGFGRDAMNRIQNHKEGGIADVYDRHGYSDENKRIMESVASHILALATGQKGTVVWGPSAPRSLNFIRGPFLL